MQLMPSPETVLGIAEPCDQHGRFHVCRERPELSHGSVAEPRRWAQTHIYPRWSEEDGLCAQGWLSEGSAAPEQVPAFWVHAYCLALGLFLGFQPGCILQSMEMQPLQDRAFKPPAQEMSLGLQSPQAGFVAASQWAHDGAGLYLP